MQSHYEINVSLNGAHFFATHERSCVDPDKAQRVYEALKKAFPENEGFTVSCKYWACMAHKALF